jgi:hypothetical protein
MYGHATTIGERVLTNRAFFIVIVKMAVIFVLGTVVIVINILVTPIILLKLEKKRRQ